MWAVCFLFSQTLTAQADAQTFEETVRAARLGSPTAQMGQEDLTMARHRVGQSVARLMPQVSLSDTFTYRENNPEKYTFSIQDYIDCDEEQSILCLPFAITDGQITLPGNAYSNILSLSGGLPISSSSITGLLQQRLASEMTHIQVDSQDERLVIDLVSEYAELQYTVGSLIMYEESLSLATETLRAVEGQHAIGEATLLDLDRAQLEVDEAARSIAQIERALPGTLERLDLLSGGLPEGTIRVCPFSENIDTGDPLSLESANRLAAAETDLRMDKLRRTSARLGTLPTLTVVGGLSYSGNGADMTELNESFMYDNWYVGGNLSMTLFDGFGSHHARRGAVASTRKSTIDVENTRRSMQLDDQELALKLKDTAEDMVLSARAVSLQEREVAATRSTYFDSGDTTFDVYTRSRSLLEQLRLQHLLLQRQQVQLTAQRWVAAGQVEPLLDQLYARERSHAAAVTCRVVSSP